MQPGQSSPTLWSADYEVLFRGRVRGTRSTPRGGGPPIDSGVIVQNACVDRGIEPRGVHLLVLPRPSGQLAHNASPGAGQFLFHTRTP